MLLWTAWAVSAVLLFFYALILVPRSNKGTAYGLLFLAVQAILFVFIKRRENFARIVLIAFFLLAIPRIFPLIRAIAIISIGLAFPTIILFGIRAVAILQLFADSSNKWFSFKE